MRLVASPLRRALCKHMRAPRTAAPAITPGLCRAIAGSHPDGQHEKSTTEVMLFSWRTIAEQVWNYFANIDRQLQSQQLIAEA